jgi:hypothetical protein
MAGHSKVLDCGKEFGGLSGWGKRGGMIELAYGILECVFELERMLGVIWE